MDDSATTVEQRALALRAEAIEICGCFAWQPQCIGSGTFDAGVREIYAELRLLQKARAVYVSQALIDCCKRHRLWFPLFEDVQARIWVFLGQRERAEQLWQGLLHHSSALVREVAKKSLKTLENKIQSGEMFATEVVQALDRNQRDRAHALLTEAILEIEDLDEPLLQAVLETTALKMPMPESFPWDRDLFTNQLMLHLYGQQLDQWEQQLDG